MSDSSNAGTEANRQTIRQAFEAWQQGTAAITEVFALVMVWRIEGHSLASKEYRSSQQFHRRGAGALWRAVPASSALPPNHDPLAP